MTRSEAVPARGHDLERLLGDPYAPGNPLGFDAILAADERAEAFADGEAALDEYGLNAEFVPHAYGGRFARVDDLVEIMRSVYRRDPALGLGYGTSSFISSVNVWAAADEEQCRTVAAQLLANRKVACAYHELAHGNDVARSDFAALPDGEDLVLNGRKEVVANIQRADALVLFARTGTGPGSRSHSQVYVDKASLPPDALRYLQRFPSLGMRGVQLGGVEFTDCRLPAGNILGRPGQGLETALKSFQVTRTAVPAMMTAVLDTGLRTTLRHVRTRHLYGRTAADLPWIRSALSGAFTDLLMCEAFASAGARALHLLPQQTSVYASAVKFGISQRLLDAMHQLSVVLGAHSYLRQGPNAIFQKLHRDLKPVGFGHAARAVCQVSVLPQLPLLAKRSWAAPAAADPALFRRDAVLPALRMDRLAVSGRGGDALVASLPTALEALPDGTDRRVHDLVAHFTAELADLTDVCAALSPAGLSFMADPAAYDLVVRYVTVLTAAACVQTWLHNSDGPDAFLADPAWLIAVLHRLRAKPGAVADEAPEDVQVRLMTELLDRHDHDRSFGIANRTYTTGKGRT
ncbi:acyl-CoA dehydrogenase [Streptomyces sp. NPDC017529]|uniref:acyl-CoA dehydrogenase n=1 Tax=Streptomyces sp. NPDC017529 TaxID=3365000 RepID=UPI00379D1AA9